MDLDDEIIQGCLVSHGGQVINERIASMLGVEIEETDQSDDEVDADEYSDDIDEDLAADMELADEDEVEVDFDDEVDADEYSDDIDAESNAEIELADEDDLDNDDE